jgi:hypothetical protein
MWGGSSLFSSSAFPFADFSYDPIIFFVEVL